MMPLNSRSHRAIVDKDGNIILPSVLSTENIERMTEASISGVSEKGETTTPSREAVVSVLSRDLSQAMKVVVTEGMRQYRVSFVDGKTLFRDLKKACGTGLRIAQDFLLQPVWVPGRRKTVRQYSRGALFALDIVRFGTTFAGIFVLLFVTLNYQSFWEIVQSRMDPLSINGSSESGINTELRNKLKRVPGLSVAGAGAAARIGDLLSYLPEIGPPENRMIIPSLHLNIPLIAPSYTALLKEDWPQVEKDIQDSLQYGVVHYPGTARPGQAGNFFVTGHSSYYPWAEGKYKTVFARLHQVNIGDEYWVYFGGDRHRYIVTEKKEVSPSNISVLDQPTDQRIATLMTCTPVGTTLRRLIVVAQEVDNDTGEALAVGEKGHRKEHPAKAAMPLEALPI